MGPLHPASNFSQPTPELLVPHRALRTPRIAHPAALHSRIVPTSPQLEPDDEQGLAFERAQLARVGSSVPIATPSVRAATGAERAPLPLHALRYLDRHDWNTEPHVLRKWASGIGVGCCADPRFEAVIEPGSPPRR